MSCSSEMSCSSGMNWAEYTQFLADKKTHQDAISNYSGEATEEVCSHSQSPILAPGFNAFSRILRAKADNLQTEGWWPRPSSPMKEPSWAPPPPTSNWEARRQSVLHGGNVPRGAFRNAPRSTRGTSSFSAQRPAQLGQPPAFRRADVSRRSPAAIPALCQYCSAMRRHESQPFPLNSRSRALSRQPSAMRRSDSVCTNTRGFPTEYSTSVPCAHLQEKTFEPHYAARYSVPSYNGGRRTPIDHSARSEYGSPFFPGSNCMPSQSNRSLSHKPSKFDSQAASTTGSRFVAVPLQLATAAGDDCQLDSEVSEASVAVMESLALTEVREKENMLKKLEDLQSYRRKFILGALAEPPEEVLEKCVQNLFGADLIGADSVSTELMEANLEVGDPDDFQFAEGEVQQDEYFHIVQVNS